ncbi:DUF805 domain-containing protein [Shinella sp.]|uniref:DUF805 domain-containing protein n=1 Tax=Shinella sp. TaxID=1870904 RepID=UPI004036ABB8
MNAYIDAMRRYFDFKGRATRTEFWMFTLVVIVGGIGALVLLVFYCQPSTPGVNRFGMGQAGKGAQSLVQARQQANAG